MLPVRSTTAAASVSLPIAAAATVSTARTSSAVRICAAPPARSDGVFWEKRIGAVPSIRAAAARCQLERTSGSYSLSIKRKVGLGEDRDPQPARAVRGEERLAPRAAHGFVGGAVERVEQVEGLRA